MKEGPTCAYEAQPARDSTEGVHDLAKDLVGYLKAPIPLAAPDLRDEVLAKLQEISPLGDEVLGNKKEAAE